MIAMYRPDPVFLEPDMHSARHSTIAAALCVGLLAAGCADRDPSLLIPPTERALFRAEAVKHTPVKAVSIEDMLARSRGETPAKPTAQIQREPAQRGPAQHTPAPVRQTSAAGARPIPAAATRPAILHLARIEYAGEAIDPDPAQVRSLAGALAVVGGEGCRLLLRAGPAGATDRFASASIALRRLASAERALGPKGSGVTLDFDPRTDADILLAIRHPDAPCARS
ncbi:hypothetical protein STAQ_10000 [Allostella sp. ATCC 35155]|nr:hypothetical protein STAQ_10000 [Stella sp. ATCC 35155]